MLNAAGGVISRPPAMAVGHQESVAGCLVGRGWGWHLQGVPKLDAATLRLPRRPKLSLCLEPELYRYLVVRPRAAVPSRTTLEYPFLPLGCRDTGGRDDAVHAEGARGAGSPGQVETQRWRRRVWKRSTTGEREVQQTGLPDEQHRLHRHALEPSRRYRHRGSQGGLRVQMRV